MSDCAGRRVLVGGSSKTPSAQTTPEPLEGSGALAEAELT
jgi:hypothetical protein